ncbi:MAG: hypothetical protein JKP95_03880 [Oceanicaulis sp.]|nr:hypothetical protein [Oceanicaulis sp.]
MLLKRTDGQGVDDMKILLVEDDELTREYVLAGLAGAGHSTDATGDGIEGLTLAARQL